MAEAQKKVSSMDDYKKDEAAEMDAMAQDAKTNTDMGKVAVFISFLAVILLVVFFFGLNQNISGLSEQVKALSGLQQEMAAMGDRVDGVEAFVGVVDGKVGALGEDIAGVNAQLAELPAETRNMIIVNDLDEMNGKLGAFSSDLDEAQAAKLAAARRIINELKVDLTK